MKSISRLSSGRVAVKTPGQVAEDRYQLLDLASAEPNLGTAVNGSVLTTTVTGQRIFTKNLAVNNIDVATNMVADRVYSDNFLYANGSPFVPPVTASNIYNGNITVGTSVTLVDTVAATGVSSVRWTITARDTVNNTLRSSTIDSVNNGANIYYNEYGVVQSNNSYEVAVFTSNISSGSINLYALGESTSVIVTYQRTTLGTGTVPGYISGAGYIQNVVGTASYVEVTGNITAQLNTRYIVDTSSANVFITMPASPTIGSEVSVIDGTGGSDTRPITLIGNGNKIQGVNENMTVASSRAAFTLVYYKATQGWILTNV